MKKGIGIVFLVMILLNLSYGQLSQELRWSGSTPYMDFSNDPDIDFDVRMILTGDNSLNIQGGNVGIGISSPSGLLHLKDAAPNWSSYNYGANLIIDGDKHNSIGFLDAGSANPMAIANINGRLTISRMPSLWNVTTPAVELFTVHTNGNVGIGNSNPQTPVDVTGNFTLRNMNNTGHGGATLHFTSYDYNNPGPKIKSDLLWAQGASSQCNLVLSSYWGGDKNELTLSNGNVGIGTSAITSKLTVAGDINSREIKVTVNAGSGPDYVFEPTYTLPSLDSVQSYINQNKHLPEVPSAKEMEANGVNLGEMNMLLLKKVEELTLYVIALKQEKEKDNKALLKRISELEKKNRQIE